MNNKKSNFPLPPKPKKNLYVGKWISIIWFCFFGIVFGIAGLFFAVSEGFLGEMPDTAELENPDIYFASDFYSSDKLLLGKF